MPWSTDLSKIAKYAATYLGDIKEKDFHYKDMSLKFFEAGHGEPVICLHTMGGTKAQWRTFMQGISKHYRVICPDIPSLSLRVGFSDGHPTKAKLLEWLSQFIQLQKLEKVNLVCHSSAGVLGANFISANADLVNSFTWVNPPDLERIRSGDVLAWEQIKGGFDSIDQIDQYLDNCFYQPPRIPDIFKRQILKTFGDAAMDVKRLAFISKELDSIPLLLSTLRRINLNTLLVTSDHDTMSSDEWSKKLQRTIPNNQLIRIERCGRLIMVEKPEVLIQTYLEFIKNI